MRVVFSLRAEHDLEEIGDYIAAENPSRAVSFIQEIREHCSKIAMSPLAYVAEIQSYMALFMDRPIRIVNSSYLTWPRCFFVK
jgi:plasmid stabilization system protein ParE